MTTNTRIDLRVPYAEKDQAKVHGAQWDSENRTWYAPPGTDLRKPETVAAQGRPDRDHPSQTRPRRRQPRRAIALTELLGRVKGVIDEGFPNRRLGSCRDQRTTWQERTPVSHPDRAQ